MNNNEMKKMKAKHDATKMIINILAEITNNPSAIFKVATIELNDKLDLIALNMEVVTEEQYKGLTNIVKQFEKVIDDYITENNIELKEENNYDIT